MFLIASFFAVPLNYIIQTNLSMLAGAANNWYDFTMKTKLFIDFDGTIFSTLAFRDKMFEIFTMAGFDEEEIKNTYAAESLDYLYSANGNLERLQKIHEYDIEKANLRMDKLIKTSKDFMFPDFDEFIQSVDREKYELDLITLGDLEFQKAKVEASGIVKYFDNVYYCEKQKWDYLDDLVELNDKFIIIDDRADTLERISKKFKRSFPILMDRQQKDLADPYLSQQKDYLGIKAKNLKQAGQYL